MRNTRIYINQLLTADLTIELDRQAAHHLTRVLRMRNNEEFTLFNGNNNEYPARLVIDNKKVFAQIIQENHISTVSSISITLLQCISKSDRMDFAIQKSTELGVSRIIPVISEYTSVNLKSERWEKKLNHWRSVIISACEQCGRNDIPDISEPEPIDQQLGKTMDGTKLILDPQADLTLSTLNPDDSKHFFLLIGPEGGLSDQEITCAGNAGFTGIRLGKRILRTETAALTTISALQTLWGDFRS